MLTCRRCNDNKSFEHFSKNKTTKSGYAHWCRSCIKDWKLNNKEKCLNSLLKCDYGISLEQYNSMLLLQKDCCAICQRHKSEFKKRLFVDHCHKTGIIRGLLCSNCNGVLGRFQDNPETFIAASSYLKKESSMS